MFSMHRPPCWKARQWDNIGAVQKHKQVEMRINYARSIFNSPIVTTTLIQYFKLETEREQSKKITKLAICKLKSRNCKSWLLTLK